MSNKPYHRDGPKMTLYKDAIGVCCIPNCQCGLQLETHHIRPLSKGGKDDYENYIVLCAQCHRSNRLHTLHKENRIPLLVYKFFMEKTVTGMMSDDLSQREEFRAALLVAASIKYRAEQNKIASLGGKCSIEGCEHLAKVQGLCCEHYCRICAPGQKKRKQKKRTTKSPQKS